MAKRVRVKPNLESAVSDRNAFKLLLHFLLCHLGRPVVALNHPDLTPERPLAFLDHL